MHMARFGLTLKRVAAGSLLSAGAFWVGLVGATSAVSAASETVEATEISEASEVAKAPAYQIEVIETEVDYPWGLAFLPDGSLLVTQLNGQLRLIKDGVLVEEPIAGVPEVFFESQGGLFDVVLHPDFADNQLLYLSFAAGTPEANGTRVVRGRFDGTALQDVELIFDIERKKDTPVHYGGRMAFDQDNH
ncbi:MAG: glucose/arabinose dehydrogenase, partial [Parvibaculaceae bacterium]